MRSAVTPRRLMDRGLRFYLYISPWIIGFVCFTVVPMGVSLILSFTSAKVSTLTTAPLKFLGWLNYREIFTLDSMFLRSIGNTFVYAVSKVLFGLLAALLIALLLNRPLKCKNLFRVLIYLPAVIPIVGSSLLWSLLIFQDRSLLVFLMESMGFGRVNFTSQNWAMPMAIFVNILGGLGPNMIVLLAGLQGIPQDQIEAADLDGAGGLQKFWYITLPMLSATLFYLLITGFIGALQAYAEIDLLVGKLDSTLTMSMAVMQNAFGGIGIGYASAEAWIIFVITMLFTLAFFKLCARRVYYGGE